MLTGEPVPVEVGPSARVVGATVNAGGRLVVRATRVGADTQLAQMAALVEQAQSGKAPVQRLADRVSAVFVPVVIALSLATLGFWLGAGAPAVGGVHRGGGRADHRLPVRARPRDADRAAGRHRPRRAARHPDQGPRGAGVHAPGRHDRAGQDGHRDHRPDVPCGRRAGRRGAGRASCCGSPARSRTPPSTRSPARSPMPPASGSATCPAGHRVRLPRRARRARQGRGTRGRRRPDARVGRLAARPARAARRGEGGRRGARPDGGHRRLGRRGARPARGRRHGQADQCRRPCASCARSASRR